MVPFVLTRLTFRKEWEIGGLAVPEDLLASSRVLAHEKIAANQQFNFN